MTLGELGELVGAEVQGDRGVAIDGVATLDGAVPGSIVFLGHPKYRPLLAATRASAVILAPDDAARTTLPKLISANPYATYAQVAAILNPERRPTPGVHPTAVIDPSATVPASAAIGPYVTMGARTTLGEGARIGAGTAIGDDCRIGADALIHPGVVIYPRTVIGARPIIHSGAIIGADGFGMAEEGGRWIKIPQLGRVVIGDNVEIGANTTIDRGAIGDTVLEDDVKLDNQIQIGHNCRIGAHTAIAGCVGIAGSTVIGRNCKIGGAAMVVGHLTIVDDVTVSGGTMIHNSIREPGIYTSIFPALPQREWRYVASIVRKLRKLVERVQALERKTPDA